MTNDSSSALTPNSIVEAHLPCIRSPSLRRLGSYLQMARERSFCLTFPTSRSYTVRTKDDSDNATRIRYSKTEEV